MITLIYRAIVLLAVTLVLAEIFSQPSMKLKINAAMVLVPLVLRVLMVA